MLNIMIPITTKTDHEVNLDIIKEYYQFTTIFGKPYPIVKYGRNGQSCTICPNIRLYFYNNQKANEYGIRCQFHVVVRNNDGTRNTVIKLKRVFVSRQESQRYLLPHIQTNIRENPSNVLGLKEVAEFLLCSLSVNLLIIQSISIQLEY